MSTLKIEIDDSEIGSEARFYNAIFSLYILFLRCLIFLIGAKPACYLARGLMLTLLSRTESGITGDWNVWIRGRTTVRWRLVDE